MNWEKVKFEDIFIFEKKSKIKAGDGLPEGKYPFFTSSSTQSKYSDEYCFDKPSLIFGTGGMASVHYCDKKFSSSTDCFVVSPKNSNEVLPKYVYYFLVGNIWILEEGFKGAGLKHISKEYMNQIDIPLPSYAEQVHITKILDKAYNIIQNQKKRLECYERLIHSIFDKMFGKINDSWPLVKLSGLAFSEKGSMRTGPFGSDLLHSEFVSTGVYVLGIDNVVNNKFEWTGTRYITKEKYSDLKRYKIFPNDVLITIMGTTGRTAVVPQNIQEAINTKHLVAVTLNTGIANPYFVSFSLRSDPKILSQIQSKQRGAIMNGLNLGLIKDLNIVLPAISIQNKFGSIFENIENQKEIAEKALINSQNLFNNLIQKAFKGELTKEIEIID